MSHLFILLKRKPKKVDETLKRKQAVIFFLRIGHYQKYFEVKKYSKRLGNLLFRSNYILFLRDVLAKKNNKTWTKVFYLYSGAPCVDCPRRGLTTSTAHFVPGIGHSCP